MFCSPVKSNVWQIIDNFPVTSAKNKMFPQLHYSSLKFIPDIRSSIKMIDINDEA